MVRAFLEIDFEATKVAFFDRLLQKQRGQEDRGAAGRGSRELCSGRTLRGHGAQVSRLEDDSVTNLCASNEPRFCYLCRSAKD